MEAVLLQKVTSVTSPSPWTSPPVGTLAFVGAPTQVGSFRCVSLGLMGILLFVLRFLYVDLWAINFFFFCFCLEWVLCVESGSVTEWGSGQIWGSCRLWLPLQKHWLCFVSNDLNETLLMRWVTTKLQSPQKWRAQTVPVIHAVMNKPHFWRGCEIAS